MAPVLLGTLFQATRQVQWVVQSMWRTVLQSSRPQCFQSLHAIPDSMMFDHVLLVTEDSSFMTCAVFGVLIILQNEFGTNQVPP